VYYMACGSQSRKVAQLAQNPATQLLCRTQDYNCTTTLSGAAELITCQETKNMVWEKIPVARDYFSGPEGADFGVLKFSLQCVEALCMSEGHEPVRVEVCS